jgi:hypothetical protein
MTKLGPPQVAVIERGTLGQAFLAIQSRCGAFHHGRDAFDFLTAGLLKIDRIECNEHTRQNHLARSGIDMLARITSQAIWVTMGDWLLLTSCTTV